MDTLTPNPDKKKPVILQVLPALKSGGVERGTIEMVRAQIAAGFEALVASEGGPMVKQITSIGGKHFTLPLSTKNPLGIRKNAKRLRKLIREQGVDLVHARSRAPAWSAYRACKKEKCHFVTTVHGPYSIQNGVKRHYNSIMVRGEKVIAISEFIRQYIHEHYKVAESDVTVIHRGVDLGYFNIKTVPDSRIVREAAKLNSEHDIPIIMLPARISEWKGHGFLLDALVHLPKDKYLCLFVGDNNGHDNYMKRLRHKIGQLGLEGNIRFVSQVFDMPAMYSLADIVVSASMRPEAFGRVAIEAQAMERLVIATNHGGSLETILDGKTGWLVEPGNVEQLAELLKKALALSDKQRKTITNRARKHVEENFSLEKMTSRTLDVYRQVLGIVDAEEEKKKPKAKTGVKPKAKAKPKAKPKAVADVVVPVAEAIVEPAPKAETKEKPKVKGKKNNDGQRRKVAG